ncbi:MAG: ABC transporter ATP-binding protein, partial [Acidobacteria bacterium]|nr:ABC transporter ATP-binding protein [Acidobacteriota bacterium]
YMSQKFSLYELLSVDQNIQLYGGIYGLRREKREERRRFVIEMAGLQGREKVLARDLPGGFRQRLALGCAIVHEPPILLLDEPTGGVDPVSRRHFWRLIDDLSRAGVTILVTTHYLDEAEYCHRIAVIHAGRLAAVGTTRELRAVFADRPVVELHGPKPVEIMRALDALPGIEKSSLFGTAVHAVLKAGGNVAAALGRTLADRGIEIRSIETVQPSLEDVFLDVVEKAERA